MASKDLRKKARQKVQAKKGLFIHMGVFVITGFFFFAMNLVTSRDVLWFYFPMIPWSVGLAIHYMLVMGIPGTDIFSSDWEEREYERELEELEWREYRNAKMRLPEHFDDEGLDLGEIPKMPKKELDDRDLV